MEYSVDLCCLSPEFYSNYPEDIYPEILSKEARPYTCLMIETNDDYLICIPFRSSIHSKNKNVFLFSNSRRSQRTRSGLDYQKTVMINKMSYITSAGSAVVDDDEYIEVITNISKIVNDIHEYISGYIAHVTGARVLHPRDYDRRYKYSTLPYFHDILGIKQPNNG